VRRVTRLTSLLLLAVAASGCIASSSTPAPRSRTTTEPPATTEPPTTTEAPATTEARASNPLYSIEPCGGITTSTDLHPAVDNRTRLLTPGDGPTGYTYGVPTLAGGPTITASVPSYSPAAYESFQVSASAGGWGGQEVIGVVGSASDAAQLAQQVESNIVSCNGGQRVSLPTSAPGVTVDTYQFALSRSSGWVSTATATVAEGPYIVSLQWSNSNSCSTYGGQACPPAPTAPPPMPSAPNMAALVNAALARLG
jgi:hypothetical protein